MERLLTELNGKNSLVCARRLKVVVETSDELEPNQSPSIRIERQTFLRLVLPIALPTDRLEDRSRRIESRKDQSGATEWKLSPLSTSDFLPHIADHLRIGLEDPRHRQPWGHCGSFNDYESGNPTS